MTRFALLPLLVAASLFVPAAQSDDGIDWQALATTALYRRKRASTLADLIRARGILTDLDAPNPASTERALESEAGVRALEKIGRAHV